MARLFFSSKKYLKLKLGCVWKQMRKLEFRKKTFSVRKHAVAAKLTFFHSFVR
jgi:DMSO/TMAO reductase YedYZ heme-binding membrane subunit